MSGNTITRRTFLTASAAMAAGGALAQPGGKQGRVVLLGFDGVKPEIVETMLKAGELPHLAKLRELGAYRRLGSSNPPQSPTAWSSFATCKWPGHHGIYDFLRRTPQNYMPGLGFGMTKHAELAPDGALQKRAEFINFRKGTPFWMTANDAGALCTLLELPYAYPANTLRDGRMICGLDVPDIRATQSTSFFLSEALTEIETPGGGMRLPLRFDGPKATVDIPGFKLPKPKVEISVPIELAVDRNARKVTVTIQGKTVELSEGEWSEYFEWTFRVNPKFAVRAISRLNVLEAGDSVKIYMTCLQCHPREPYVPITYPDNYAAELTDRYGLYKTIGWAYDTKGFERDDMTPEMFLEDIAETMAWRERLMLDELDAGRFDLLLAGWTGTDRVGHMFWRCRDEEHPLFDAAEAAKYGRALEDTYIKMDDIVGKTMNRLEPSDLLMVMSDHGFHSSRYAFSINTWLVRNGYLAVKDQTNADTAYTDEKYGFGFDWGRTKLYGLGLGSVYVNEKGREGQGTVAPSEVTALLAEVREKLLKETDPNTGRAIFRNIYTREVYRGESQADAPDIQLAFDDGYQNTKASAAGAAPKEVLEPNKNKWSGDHAASDVAITDGVLFANAPLPDTAKLVDLGPTALKHLDIEPPKDYEGRALI